MIQVSSVWVAPVSRAIDGSATFRPLTADTTAIRDRPTTGSTSLVRRAERIGTGAVTGSPWAALFLNW